MVCILALSWTSSKVHEVSEQILRGLPPVLHHENNGPLLIVTERNLCVFEDTLNLILQLGKRVRRCGDETLLRRRLPTR
jgi:hypothetical protein